MRVHTNHPHRIIAIRSYTPPISILLRLPLLLSLSSFMSNISLVTRLAPIRERLMGVPNLGTLQDRSNGTVVAVDLVQQITLAKVISLVQAGRLPLVNTMVQVIDRKRSLRAVFCDTFSSSELLYVP